MAQQFSITNDQPIILTAQVVHPELPGLVELQQRIQQTKEEFERLLLRLRNASAEDRQTMQLWTEMDRAEAIKRKYINLNQQFHLQGEQLRSEALKQMTQARAIQSLAERSHAFYQNSLLITQADESLQHAEEVLGQKALSVEDLTKAFQDLQSAIAIYTEVVQSAAQYRLDDLARQFQSAEE